MGIEASRRTSAAAALAALLAVAACQKSGSSQGEGAAGVASIAGMAADPEREVVYFGDADGGRVLALSTADGSVQRTLSLGAAIGGLALDHCFTKLYVSVTGGMRVDVIDLATFERTGTVALDAFPYAIASGTNDHVVVATSRGLLDVDPATGYSNTLKDPVDPPALLSTNRAGDVLFVVESAAGEAGVTRIDLRNNKKQPPVRSPDHAFAGNHVGFALSLDERRVYVATDGNYGVFQLDAASLQPRALLAIGPNIDSIAVNPTSTRLYFSRGDRVVRSVNLDHLVNGASLDLGANVQERGLFVAANGLSLLAHDAKQAVQSHFLFDVHLNGPSAVPQGATYRATIEGPPDAVYFFFASGQPGYLYLDPPTADEPRFLDLELGAGLTPLFTGRLDADGHATLEGTAPSGLQDETTILFQAIAQPQPGLQFTEISNPLLVRFLGPDCSGAPSH